MENQSYPNKDHNYKKNISEEKESAEKDQNIPIQLDERQNTLNSYKENSNEQNNISDMDHSPENQSPDKEREIKYKNYLQNSSGLLILSKRKLLTQLNVSYNKLMSSYLSKF